MWAARGRNRDTFTDFAVLPPFAGMAVHDRHSLSGHPDLAKRSPS
jgi:hypothetical protein